MTPVGSSEERGVDLRMVAATHRDIAYRVGSGQFRADLMYRLRVVPIVLPPLRARDGDIELLLRHFLSHFNDRGPRRIETIEPSALEALTRHHWPGNLRELRNVVEHAFAIGRGETLSIHDLPAELGREASRKRRASEEGPPSPRMNETRSQKRCARARIVECCCPTTRHQPFDTGGKEGDTDFDSYAPCSDKKDLSASIRTEHEIRNFTHLQVALHRHCSSIS